MSFQLGIDGDAPFVLGVDGMPNTLLLGDSPVPVGSQNALIADGSPQKLFVLDGNYSAYLLIDTPSSGGGGTGPGGGGGTGPGGGGTGPGGGTGTGTGPTTGGGSSSSSTGTPPIQGKSSPPPPPPYVLDFNAILTQINNLPNTFTRPGSGFQNIQIARAAALLRYANGVGGLVSQLQFSQAQGVWLDVWGKLFGIPRNADERDDLYGARISATLVAGRATPIAILIYLQLALGITATVTEDFTHSSWKLQLNTPLSTTAFRQLIENLAYVRPAGVPAFTFGGSQGGMYLGAVNYVGSPRVTGAYLKTPAQGIGFTIGAYTNNSEPLLPTTFLSDPTLNPGL